MRQVLRLHQDSHCAAAAHIEVDIARPHADRLVLSYIVTGKMNDVRMPPVGPAARSDGLWRHTCFEAFVRAASGTAYYEFNFAPSTQWAVYRFSGYRSAMGVATEIDAMPIDVRSSHDRCTLQASLPLKRLAALPRAGAWRLGLAAVIEETGGGMSYWALAHPPGKPDFHQPDCFVHEFSPAVQS